MDVEFDPAKDAANIKAHGLSLARAADVAVKTLRVDARFAYGETRYRAFGLLDARPCCLIFTIRQGRVRAISLRRAHRKEYRRHVQED